MTREEFELKCAGDLPLLEWRRWLRAEPCACGEDDCEGWRVAIGAATQEILDATDTLEARIENAHTDSTVCLVETIAEPERDS